MRFPTTNLCLVALAVLCGCQGSIDTPAETTSGTTSAGGSTSTPSTGSGGAPTTTGGQGGDCGDMPPDPDCGCAGWETSDLCRCDCGGTLVESSHLNASGCQSVLVDHACPNGWGGAGGAPSVISCELLQSTKICGP